MKMTRKLIPALAMLLISAVLMSTASYAWFSMNTSVSAEGMSITAKNDSKYLQIIAGSDAGAFDANLAQTEVTITMADPAALRPTALVSAISEDKKSTTPYAGAINTAAGFKWVEAFSDDPAKEEIKEGGTYNDVTNLATVTAEENVYTLYNVFTVRMNPKTGATTGTNLTVSNVTITAKDEDAKNLLSAVRVAIVGADTGVIYDAEGNKVGKTVDGTVSSVITNTVTTAGTQVHVYIYFYGEDEATYTNNVDAGQYNVEFTLSIA